MVRIYDPYTEQVIDTTIEKISLTKLAINHDLSCKGEVSYNKFIKLLGGKISKNIELLGWSLGNDIQDWNWSFEPGYWIEVYLSEMHKDGQEFQVISFNVGPEVQCVELMD